MCYLVTSRCEDCIMSSACLTRVVYDIREMLKHSGTLLFVSACLLQGGEIIDKLQTLVSKQRLFADKQLSVCKADICTKIKDRLTSTE